MYMAINEENVVAALREAGEKLESKDGSSVLDFSSLRRLDSAAVRQMEQLAQIVEEKGAKVVLRAVNVEVYKVLKLVKLTRQFSFEN
jgi:anti-anti-sigma regulatory factor